HLLLLVFSLTLEVGKEGLNPHAGLVVEFYVHVLAGVRAGARDNRDDGCQREKNGQHTTVQRVRNPLLLTTLAAADCVDGLMVVDPGEVCILRILGKLHGIYLLDGYLGRRSSCLPNSAIASTSRVPARHKEHSCARLPL